MNLKYQIRRIYQTPAAEMDEDTDKTTGFQIAAWGEVLDSPGDWKEQYKDLIMEFKLIRLAVHVKYGSYDRHEINKTAERELIHRANIAYQDMKSSQIANALTGEQKLHLVKWLTDWHRTVSEGSRFRELNEVLLEWRLITGIPSMFMRNPPHLTDTGELVANYLARETTPELKRKGWNNIVFPQEEK